MKIRSALLTILLFGLGSTLAFSQDLRLGNQSKMILAQGWGNRVEYKHQALTEWYVNGPLGLEQGFTFDRSSGRTNGEPLTLRLALSGTSLATLSADGNDVWLARRYQRRHDSDRGAFPLRS